MQKDSTIRGTFFLKILIGVMVCSFFTYIYISSRDKPNLGENRVDQNYDVMVGNNRLLASNVGRLASEQKELRGEVLRLESQLDAKEYGLLDTDEEVELSDGEGGDAESDEEKLQGVVAMFNRKINTESNDPEWSRNASDDIDNKYMGFGILNTLKTQCQSTICKIDVEFAEPQRADENAEMLMLNQPWNGPSFVLVEPGGKTATMFLAREGFKLPKDGNNE